MNLKLKLQSLDKKILQIYIKFLKTSFKKLNICFNQSFLPKKIKKITFLRSPHVYKTAREQFQLIKYNFVFFIFSLKNYKIIKQFILNKPYEIKITMLFHSVNKSILKNSI